MGSYSFKIYAPGNFSGLPAEDGTQRSALEPGDTIVFNGGGEVATVTVDDPTNSTFSEIETDQTLVDPITFDGVSYSVGQQVTPSYNPSKAHLPPDHTRAKVYCVTEVAPYSWPAADIVK